MYRLQHCLEWAMQVYKSKLTPESVVTYLFRDCKRSLWLFCLVWHVRAMIKVQYTLNWHLERLPVLRVWTMFEGLRERVSIWFPCHFAGFHVVNRVVTLLLLMRRCMKRVFVANTVAHAYQQRVHLSFRDATVDRSAVRAQPWLLQRLLGLFVARCALVRNSL